jgi:hypothetical protein
MPAARITAAMEEEGGGGELTLRDKDSNLD